jgi:amidase
MSRGIGHFFEKFDILMTPTLALPPIKTGALQPTKKDAFIMKSLGRLNAGGLLMAFKGIEDLAQKAYTFMPYTPLFNVTGQPAMSVPLHWNDEGLPIGVQFVGRTADEATLFRLASQLERVKPWSNRIPPVCKSG